MDGTDIRGRLARLRRDFLHIRRVLSPTRDSVNTVVNRTLDLEGEEVFPSEIELEFRNGYEKLLRASEGLELARDLLAGVRDYHQAKVANDQNEVMKRLTAIASLLLVPALIVGIYGQNFENLPESTGGGDTAGPGV